MVHNVWMMLDFVATLTLGSQLNVECKDPW
jgi:hypothetical protein